MPDPKYFSSAALSAYLQYPYKFKILYIDCVGTAYKKPQPYHSFGNTIHKVFVEFFKITNLQERTINKLLSLLVLETFWISEGDSTKEQETLYKHNAVYLLRDFFANNVSQSHLCLLKSFLEQTLKIFISQLKLIIYTKYKAVLRLLITRPVGIC